MAIREIRKQGDECLNKKCREVSEINDRIMTLLDDMWDTLHAVGGLGLAAPQVGVLRKVVIIEFIDEEEDINEKFELINPVITEREGSVIDVEGCLSVPGRYGKVERPERITVVALDRDGVEHTYKPEGYLARCFCHEIDHLDGVLYTEKVIEYVDMDGEK